MQTLTDYTFHEVANIFPMMSDDEFAALVEDIRANGQRQPIYVHDGRIIDGRNRYRACQQLGIEPEVRTWDGAGSLVSFVVSLNLQRRHLSSSQKATVGLDVLPMLESEAKERQLAQGERGNEGGRGNAKTLNQLIDEGFDEPQRKPAPQALEQAAQLVGTNRQYVSDAKRLRDEAPELLERVRSGELTIPQAKREIKETRREIVRENNRALVAATIPATQVEPGATYQTIVLDPPWDWGDEGDADQFGRARPTYATMSIDQIAALPVRDLAADNAHIYLWITNRSLPKGFALLEAWGFRYVACVTWCKPSIGMGNYFRGSTEQILFGVRGSLPLLRNNVGTWFSAPRGDRHSAKPTAFYEMVESCSPGPWLEMFARSERSGWAQWGAEVPA